MLTVTTIEDESQMPNARFWKFVEEERTKRGWSYAELEERGGKGKGKGAGVYRAIEKNYELTLPMVDVIARAFDMSRLDVLRKAKFIILSPEDIDEPDLTAAEIFEIARKLPIEKQRDIIRMMRGLLDDSGDGD